ncbi:MAG: polysaccharide biosynthesis C-terminal domain-containing protein, partial [Oscillospiraceae bacterium]|nr:polysaccharide biosynthesis C-terminal domain-containing protein [Oscillospiraceae bacterium]
SAERALGVDIAAPALALLGIGVIFVALLTPINSMLQAVGRADIPVKLMLVGGTIKIITNFVLVAVPSINVKGAPVGTILCYVFLFLASIFFLCREIGTTPGIKTTFIKPFAAAAACGGAAAVSYNLLEGALSSNLTTVISIIFAAIIYAICLLLFKVLSKDDIIMLPKGKKIVKILEKRGWIG